MAAKPIPDGYHTITPYIYLRGAAKAMDFYKKAFGAIETVRMPGPDGRIGHAEMKIGDSFFMLADESAEMEAHSPEKYGGSPVSILLYVPDVDAMAKTAIAAGAKVIRPVEDKFYGDRMGSFTDPFGHTWHIGTHKEDVSPEEMRKRMDAMCKQKA